MLNSRLRAGIAVAFLRSARMISSSTLGSRISTGRLPWAPGCSDGRRFSLSSISESIFSRCDLPDPKNPEIQTPLAVGLCR